MCVLTCVLLVQCKQVRFVALTCILSYVLFCVTAKPPARGSSIPDHCVPFDCITLIPFDLFLSYRSCTACILAPAKVLRHFALHFPATFVIAFGASGSLLFVSSPRVWLFTSSDKPPLPNNGMRSSVHYGLLTEF